jgi:hypothetical protein
MAANEQRNVIPTQIKAQHPSVCCANLMQAKEPGRSAKRKKVLHTQ